MFQIPKFQNFNVAARAQMGAFGGRSDGLSEGKPPGGGHILCPGPLATERPHLRAQPRNSDRGSEAKMPGNLRINHLVVDELVPYARNARTHSEEQVTERKSPGPSWAKKHQGYSARSNALVSGLFSSATLRATLPGRRRKIEAGSVNRRPNITVK